MSEPQRACVDHALTANTRKVLIPVPDEPDLYQHAILWIEASLKSGATGVRLKWYESPDDERLLWEHDLTLGGNPHFRTFGPIPLFLLMRNGLEVEASADCVLTVSGSSFLQQK